MALRSRWRRILGWTVVIAFAGAYVIGSEVYYLESNSPRGLKDIRGYFDRFGEPRSARIIGRDGQTYYEIRGHLPKWYVFAHPSSPPAYIFDVNGKFLEWCDDPGDVLSYQTRWSYSGHSREVAFTDLRQRFGF